jgi:5-methylcytosine-specific restriction endonuclease McrA
MTAKFNDLTGKKFNKLLVLALSHKTTTNYGSRRYYWLCRCDCGIEKPIDGRHLIDGTTKSCGCSRWELISYSKYHFHDYTNIKFNSLTAIKPVGTSKCSSSGRLWLFKCDCGAEKVLPIGRVKYGHAATCGHWRREFAVCHPTRQHAGNGLCKSCVRTERQKRIKEASDGTVTAEILKTIYAQSICFYCQQEISPKYRTIDHKLPIIRGGKHSIDNICMACKDCNYRKHDKTVEEYWAWKLVYI